MTFAPTAASLTLTIYDSNTFNVLAVDRSLGDKTVKFANSTTQTVNNDLSIPTSGTTVVTLTNTSGTTPWIISKSSGQVVLDYLDVSYSTATGGATWYAGSHSTGGGNTGWLLSDPGGRPTTSISQ